MNILYKTIPSLVVIAIFAISSMAASSMVEVTYFSKTMNSNRKLMVYLPDGYGSNTTTYFPIFYLMHGGGQRYYTWANTNDGNAQAILDQAISSGKAKKMMVVMADAPDFAPDLFTRELVNDVIPFVEKTYRAKTDKDSRALAGLSWGGLQVLDAGLYRYDLFGYLGVFSSGWFIGDNVYNVMNRYLATSGANIQKSMRYLYYGQGGTSDIAYNNGMETMKVLRSHGITVNYWEHTGSHSFVAWRQDLRDFLPFLFQYGLGTQTPFKDTPHAIPGKVEAEEYDNGGQGVAYFEANANGNESGATLRNDEVDIEVTTDANGGHNIGYALKGEWLEYSVNITSTGSYSLDLRLAADGTGRTMHVEMDGVNISGAIAVPNTAGWQTWQTVTVNNLNLTAGKKVMRIVFDTDYINFNFVEFKKMIPTGLDDENIGTTAIFPNPFSAEGLHISKQGSFRYKITDMRGMVMEQGQNNQAAGLQLVPGVYLLSLESEGVVTQHKIVRK